MTLARRIGALFLAFTASGCNGGSASTALDYEQMILLDAEDLAEAGIGEAYARLLPQLSPHIAQPEPVEELIDQALPRYAIRHRDEEYLVHSPDTAEGESWGVATHVLFKVVNDQLADTGVRMYAINSGHDPGGLLLTPAQAQAARRSLPNPSDWPHLPEATGPWYGQHQ